MKIQTVITMLVAMFLLATWQTPATAIEVSLALKAATASSNLRLMSANDTFELRRAATCRLRVRTDTIIGRLHDEYGSGTIFNKRTLSDGKTVGLVATCAHIFPVGWTVEQCRQLYVDVRVGSDQELREAQILMIDWSNDLSVWSIFVDADQQVIPLADTPLSVGDTCVVCTFGTNGAFTTRAGVLQGYVSVGWNGGWHKVIPSSRMATKYKSSGRNQIYITNMPVYQGNSGGGILTTDNRLAGVLWGGCGGVTAYGTYAGTLKRLISTQLPSTYSWGCQPQQGRWGSRVFQCPPGYQPANVIRRIVNPGQQLTRPGGDAGSPVRPQRDLVVPPPTSDPPTSDPPTSDPPTSDPPGYTRPATDAKRHEEVMHAIQIVLEAVQASQGEHTIALEELSVGQKTLAGMVPVLQQGQAGVLGALVELQGQVDELLTTEREISIHVESPKFISPSYVDVSVLWALQQSTSIDHMVLITNTTSGGWDRLKSEFEKAQVQFPAIILFDVASRGLRFKELPQLVVYPVNPDQPPTIIKGTDLVAKQLQAIVRDW